MEANGFEDLRFFWSTFHDLVAGHAIARMKALCLERRVIAPPVDRVSEPILSEELLCMVGELSAGLLLGILGFWGLNEINVKATAC